MNLHGYKLKAKGITQMVKAAEKFIENEKQKPKYKQDYYLIHTRKQKIKRLTKAKNNIQNKIMKIKLINEKQNGNKTR